MLVDDPQADAPGGLLNRSAHLIRSHAGIFVVLAIWAFAPLIALLIYVGQHGGVITGANGTDAFDQYQYLAWIRDEGSHFLASNLWQVGGTPHDYLNPMWVISGLLWRLGLSLQLAYLVWKPVALLVLFLGFGAYVQHLLPQRRGEQAAALLLALFYLTPVLALARWTGHLSAFHQYQLVLATADAYAATTLWGLEHTAIAIGLMPVFLIAVERLISQVPDQGATRLRVWRVIAAIAGLLIAWLHPWQAVILLGIVGGLFVLAPPRRRYLGLIAPLAAILLALIYGELLSHFDSSWHTFQIESQITGTAPWWALLAGFGPLTVVALLGLQPPRSDREWMLVLWPVACVGVYFFVPELPPHALSGVTLPLAVLAVRGWRRVRLPSRLARGPLVVGVGVLALLVFTLPAAVNSAQGPVDDFSSTPSGAYKRGFLRLNPDEAAAVDYLDHTRDPGAVLAPLTLSMPIPALTGREVYAGHGDWQPASHVATTETFFDAGLADPSGTIRRHILGDTGVAFVIADCPLPPLTSYLNRIVRPVKRFGCVTVYRTK